ncbi:hypothetical protein MUK42_18242 [Musa troglodytarum]|uniref:Uncharacterized protein n=1 Tax=Musa troglodytarum TaxID=320322 RepID=A0A9E7H8Q9_9LILI|nr:hypothetical protein MUK42_18242 [Musa troglodytarum]
MSCPSILLPNLLQNDLHYMGTAETFWFDRCNPFSCIFIINGGKRTPKMPLTDMTGFSSPVMLMYPCQV